MPPVCLLFSGQAVEAVSRVRYSKAPPSSVATQQDAPFVPPHGGGVVHQGGTAEGIAPGQRDPQPVSICPPPQMDEGRVTPLPREGGIGSGQYARPPRGASIFTAVSDNFFFTFPPLCPVYPKPQARDPPPAQEEREG